jgi:hypothetical protein
MYICTYIHTHMQEILGSLPAVVHTSEQDDAMVGILSCMYVCKMHVCVYVCICVAYVYMHVFNCAYVLRIYICIHPSQMIVCVHVCAHIML